MTMKRALFTIVLFIAIADIFAQHCDAADDFEVKVRKAVDMQMENYPKSTLKDLYKNFFQDRFGPGHLITDTAAARNYLLRELASFETSSGKMTEIIGWEHNFYRVNLSALKEKRIPIDLFIDALIRSANEIKPVSIEMWRDEWSRIETIINTMNLDLPDYETDSGEIKRRLTEGRYVGHHSQAFNEAYAPHYRIISKAIFEKKLLPLLHNDNSTE